MGELEGRFGDPGLEAQLPYPVVSFEVGREKCIDLTGDQFTDVDLHRIGGNFVEALVIVEHRSIAGPGLDTDAERIQVIVESQGVTVLRAYEKGLFRAGPIARLHVMQVGFSFGTAQQAAHHIGFPLGHHL